eukprot:scaffold73649_cov21-Tisochrysis_lutea.AAC.1
MQQIQSKFIKSTLVRRVELRQAKHAGNEHFRHEFVHKVRQNKPGNLTFTPWVFVRHQKELFSIKQGVNICALQQVNML